MQDPSKVYQELLTNKDRNHKGYLQNVLFQKSFPLLVNQVKALFPVRHKLCQKNTQDQHVCGCLDQILKGQNQKCEAQSLNNIQDLVAAKDHYDLIQQFNVNTKEVSIFNGDAFNKMVRIERYLQLLSDKQIQNIYQQVKIRNDMQNNISEIIKKHPKYKNFETLEFYAACHLDFVKLILPMRFRACKHMECFDFTTICYRLDTEIKNKTTGRVICGMETNGQFCDSWCYADYNSMIAELVIDQELLQLLKKAETFNQKFIYKNGKVQDLLTFQEQQLLLSKQQLTQNQKQVQIAQQAIHEHLNSIMNLKQSEKAQKIIQKYQNFEINRRCPLSAINNLFGQNLLIEFPGRCTQCDQPQCADLRNLIDNFLTFKKNHQEKFYKCPLCGYDWNKSRAVSLLPTQLFYFDETMMGLYIQNQDINNCDKAKIDYQGQTTLLNEYKKSYKISREQVSDTYPSGWVTYRSIKCIVSDTILKNPLNIRNCKQESRVSFDAFFTKFQQQKYKLDKDNPIKLCKCYDCQQEIGITSFYELAFDEVMNEMLTTVPNIANYGSEFVKYNLKTKQIDQAKYNGIKILYPNKPGRGYLSVMKDEEFEEYCKQFEETNFQGFNVKMDTYKFKQGNLEFQFDQNGAQLQGGQEFFNSENEIKTKYGINITQVTFKPNAELIGLKGQVTLESKQFK